MLCFPNWPSYRFKSQLQIGFSLFNITVLAAIFITIFLFTYLSTANNETFLRNRLNDAAQGYTRAIVSDSARVFDKLLARSARNFLNPIALSASDYLRADHPYAPAPTYYEYCSATNPASCLLAPPVAFDARYNSKVSFTTGGYSVALQKDPFATGAYPVGLNSTIVRTESVMPLLKSLYQSSPEFLGGYWCLDADPLQPSSQRKTVFREYPAASNGDLSFLGNYVCSDDDWFVQGKLSALSSTGQKQRPTSYSPVYVDPWVKQTMITIIQPVFHPSTGALVGVAGGDLLTADLQSSINNVKYLTNGRSVLFEINADSPGTGVVIADTARTIGAPQTTKQSYTALTNPSISPEAWSQIFQTSSNGFQTPLSTFSEQGDWFVAAEPLKSGNNQYLLVIFVLKRDVTQVLDPVLSDISTARSRAIIVNSVVCAVVLVVAALVNIVLANIIVRPIQRLTQDSARLIERIGADDLAVGLMTHEANSAVSETRQLQVAHAAMIQAIQAQHQQAAQRDAMQQAAARVDYALPAYSPESGFDPRFLQGEGGQPGSLPMGILVNGPASAPSASYATSSPVYLTPATASPVGLFSPTGASPPGGSVVSMHVDNQWQQQQMQMQGVYPGQVQVQSQPPGYSQ